MDNTLFSMQVEIEQKIHKYTCPKDCSEIHVIQTLENMLTYVKNLEKQRDQKDQENKEEKECPTLEK